MFTALVEWFDTWRGVVCSEGEDSETIEDGEEGDCAGTGDGTGTEKDCAGTEDSTGTETEQ